MNILLLLVPLAIGLGLFFVAGFFWATHDGQFENLDAEAIKPFLKIELSKRKQNIEMKKHDSKDNGNV